MRRLLVVVVGCTLLLSVSISPAGAVLVNITYTADNVIGAWFQNGSAPVAQALGPNAANWQVADTAMLNLSPGSYQLIFRVRNDGAGSSTNPAALLTEVQGAGVGGDLLTSKDWEWAPASGADPADFTPLAWAAATEYGNNGGANIWTNVHGGPVAGISTSAQWIWSNSNFSSTMDQELYLRGELTVVPEPLSLTLLGFGLFGAGVMRQRKRKA